MKINVFSYSYIVIALFFILLETSFVQDGPEKSWKKDSPLTWEDFKRPTRSPDLNDKTVANTFLGERYRYRRLGEDSSNYKFEFQVKSVMVRTMSWVNPASKTASLLSHEQLHFDISEFFARKLLIAFQNGQYTKDYVNEIKEIKREITKRRNHMENLYDEQTNHSLDIEMQLKWHTYVQNLLDNDTSLEVAFNTLPKL